MPVYYNGQRIPGALVADSVVLRDMIEAFRSEDAEGGQDAEGEEDTHLWTLPVSEDDYALLRDFHDSSLRHVNILEAPRLLRAMDALNMVPSVYQRFDRRCGELLGDCAGLDEVRDLLRLLPKLPVCTQTFLALARRTYTLLVRRRQTGPAAREVCADVALRVRGEALPLAVPDGPRVLPVLVAMDLVQTRLDAQDDVEVQDVQEVLEHQFDYESINEIVDSIVQAVYKGLYDGNTGNACYGAFYAICKKMPDDCVRLAKIWASGVDLLPWHAYKLRGMLTALADAGFLCDALAVYKHTGRNPILADVEALLSDDPLKPRDVAARARRLFEALMVRRHNSLVAWTLLWRASKSLDNRGAWLPEIAQLSLQNPKPGQEQFMAFCCGPEVTLEVLKTQTAVDLCKDFARDPRLLKVPSEVGFSSHSWSSPSLVPPPLDDRRSVEVVMKQFCREVKVQHANHDVDHAAKALLQLALDLNMPKALTQRVAAVYFGIPDEIDLT
jgi:hypothetical protein